MSKKNKNSKKGKAESANKKRVILRLQKYDAFEPESAKTLKDVGLGEGHKYDRHIEQLISEGILKQEEKSDVTKYWLVRSKVNPKKKSGAGNFLAIWLGSAVVLLIIIIVFFNG